MKTLLVVLIGLGWVGCGPFLAWFMGKRGYDAFSWLAVGSITGPSALAMAMFERWAWTPPLPEVVVRGKNAGGSVNVLVLMDGGNDVVSVARPLLTWFGSCLGRLTIGRVLPEGGPSDEQRRATRAIAEAVERIQPYSAEGMLLFGLTESAVSTLVRDEQFHVVITVGPKRAVSDALEGTNVLHVDGPQYAPTLLAKSSRDRGLHRTNSNWISR